MKKLLFLVIMILANATFASSGIRHPRGLMDLNWRQILGEKSSSKALSSPRVVHVPIAQPQHVTRTIEVQTMKATQWNTLFFYAGATFLGAAAIASYYLYEKFDREYEQAERKHCPYFQENQKLKELGERLQRETERLKLLTELKDEEASYNGFAQSDVIVKIRNHLADPKLIDFLMAYGILSVQATADEQLITQFRSMIDVGIEWTNVDIGDITSKINKETIKENEDAAKRNSDYEQNKASYIDPIDRKKNIAKWVGISSVLAGAGLGLAQLYSWFSTSK